MPIPRWLATLIASCTAFLLVGLTLWVLVHALARVVTVTAAVVVALLLAALLSPVDRVLRRARLPHALTAVLTIVVLLGFVGGIVTLFVEGATRQADDLQQAATDGLDEVRRWLDDGPIPVSQGTIDNLDDRVASLATGLLPTPADGAAMVSETLAGVLLMFFLLFFLLKDGARMWEWALEQVPRRRRDSAAGVGEAAWQSLTGYVRGTTIIALVDATGIGVVMAVLGVPLAVSLTLIVFVAAYVPIVGAFVSGGLAVLVTLVAVGPAQALVLLVAVVAVQQLEGNVLQPWVMGRALALHPVVVVLGVAVGGLLGGVLGAIVVVPVMATTWRVYRQFRRPETEPPSTGGVAADDPDDLEHA